MLSERLLGGKIAFQILSSGLVGPIETRQDVIWGQQLLAAEHLEWEITSSKRGKRERMG